MIAFLKIVLFPFAVLFRIITDIRNWCYDKGIFESVAFDFPLIGIGNLSTGGTGKTPFTIFLLENLPYDKMASLSRGYKRHSNGFQIVDLEEMPKKFGDEAYLVKMKVNEAFVTVCEKRVDGVHDIFEHQGDVEAIVLDDCLQHRSIKAKVNVLLSDYNAPFYEDYVLPTGNLRESRKHADKADIAVITKCPTDISEGERLTIREKVKRYGDHKEIYFSFIEYGQSYDLFSKAKVDLSAIQTGVVVTGIANNDRFVDYLNKDVERIEVLSFEDHHEYDTADLEKINDHLNQSSATKKVILTTEKDAVKLYQYQSVLEEDNITVVVVPIQIDFIGATKQEVIDKIVESL